jgi:regulator of nonsense transcripts 1
MEAFTRMGNHLVSDSAPRINAGDDVETVDGDESLLNEGGSRRRRHDDEDEESDGYDDDDLESMASVPVHGAGELPAVKADEEKELPPHACA